MAEREPFPKKEEYDFPRRRNHNSKPTRKDSRLSYGESFIPKDKQRLSDRDKSPKVLYEHKNGRERSIQKLEGKGYNDKLANRKTSSESSGKIYTDKSKHETFRRISTERSKSHVPDKIFTDKSMLGYTKKNEPYVNTTRNKKISKVNKSSHSDDKDSAKRLDTVENDDEWMTSGEYKRDRTVLPSRVSLRCQGIRHAFGLSNAYCNCVSTGSRGRTVRRKRISRGVQCDGSDICKHRISSVLGGCFAFKYCAGKTKQRRKKKSEISAKKTESVASSDIYKPKKNEYKKTKRSKEAIRDEMLIQKVTRNHRMIGGGEEITSQRLQIAETPKRIQKTDILQRDQRVMRRTIEPVEGNSINKNNILQVKRRLNECLIELNEIIGDVGFIF